jgi:hypothetical protein
MRVLLFLLIFASIPNIYGQIQFEYIDNTSNQAEYVASALELKTGGYLLAIRKYQENGGAYCRLVKLDVFGNFMQEKIVFDRKSLLINSIVETEFGVLMFGTSSDENCGFFTSTLFDLDLNITNKDSLNLGIITQSSVQSTELDNFILISGTYSGPLIYERSFIAKTSNSGKIYDSNLHFYDFIISNGVAVPNLNEFLFLSYSSKYLSADTSLTYLDYEDPNQDYRLLLDGTISNGNDSTLVIVGKKNNIAFFPPYDSTRRIGIGVLTNNLEPINLYQIGKKGDTLNFPAYNKAICYGLNNEVYVGGNSNNQLYAWLFSNQNSWYILSRLNKDGFSPKWVKYYGGDAYYTMFGVIATSDGGAIMYGSKFNKQGSTDSEAYILKVNSDGLLAEYSPPKEGMKISIFNNSFNDYFVVNSDLEMFELNIFNILGQKVKSVFVTSTNLKLTIDDSSGVYFFNCIKNNNIIKSGKLIKQ